jgi:hypothetical protein
MQSVPGLGSLSGGTFSQAPVQGSDLNVYLFPDAFGFITTGGIVWPGVVWEIKGASRKQDWAFQKSTSGNGYIATWKGQKAAESIKITIKVFDWISFAGLYGLKRALLPIPGQKPPSLDIQNGWINFNEITQIALVEFGQPEWDRADNSGSVVVELCEYDPTTAAMTGPATPASPDNPSPDNPSPDPPDPNADIKGEIQKQIAIATANA